MRFRRLGWAGVELACAGENLLIDYVQDLAPMAPFLRTGREAFPTASNLGTAVAALLTHLHADHADPDALALALRPGAPVYRPEASFGRSNDVELTVIAEEKFRRQLLNQQIVGDWEHFCIASYEMTSVPAVDGFGDPQRSWVVEAGGKRIFHGGDSLFHGNWWRVAHRFGKIDVAFLPVNAPVCNWAHLQPPSSKEATMTPEEAALAAHLMGARCVVPIHYGDLNDAAHYAETPQAIERLGRRAADFDVQIMELVPGEWTEI